MPELDALDRRLITLLRRDGRASIQELCAELGTSRPTVNDRLRRLRQRGYVRGFTAVVDWDALGYGVQALIGITATQGEYNQEIVKAVRSIEAVEDAWVVAGRYDLILRVRARSHKDLEEVLFGQIQRIPGFGRSETMIVLSAPVEYRSPTAPGEPG